MSEICFRFWCFRSF